MAISPLNGICRKFYHITFFLFERCDLFSSRLRSRSAMPAKWQKLLTQQFGGHFVIAFMLCIRNRGTQPLFDITLPTDIIAIFYRGSSFHGLNNWMERRKKNVCYNLRVVERSVLAYLAHNVSGWQLCSTFISSRRTRATDKIQLLYSYILYVAHHSWKGDANGEREI